VGPISSIEYINTNLEGRAQGSVFDIFFNNTTCTLPVKLTSFNAAKAGNAVQLHWQVAEQSNLAYYAVERSDNNKDYTTIATLDAKNAAGSYSYTDPVNTGGDYYYRLKMIDIDGKTEFSKAMQVSINGRLQIRVTPNPATTAVTIQGLNGISNIVITNLCGQQLKKWTTRSTAETVNISALAAGVYVVQIFSNGKIVATERFTK
jgi:hypothetical protein